MKEVVWKFVCSRRCHQVPRLPRKVTKMLCERLCVTKLCLTKLCVTKLLCERLCVTKLCVCA